MNPTETEHLRLDIWKGRWQNQKDCKWHLQDVNPHLIEFYQKIKSGRESITVLLPLCGKSVDIKWLYDNGHQVIGADVAPIPCEEFFQEFDIPYIISPAKSCDGNIYMSEDGRIKLYCCNIFDLASELQCKVDAIWDRRSIIALHPSLWERYVEDMLSLMTDDSTYMIETICFDPNIMKDRKYHPYSIPDEKVYELYGDRCVIDRLWKRDTPANRERFNTSMFTTSVHIMKLKPV